MRIILFSVLLSIAGVCYAQELLTLDDAIQTALRNNFSITVAAGERDIAANNFSAGNAGFLPDLTAQGTFTKSNNNARLEFFSGQVIDRKNAKSSSLNANIALNWTVFDGFAMFAAYDQLEKLKQIGELNYRISVENNVADVINTYYDLVRQNVVVHLQTRNINISEERVKLAENRRSVGSASKFELLQSQVDLNEDKSALLSAQLSYEQLKTRLNTLLGRDPGVNFSVGDTIIIKQGMILEDLQAAAESRNAEILRAVQDKNVSQAQVALARSAWYPQLGVFGSYNFLRSESEAGQTKSNRNQGYSYGLNASINLFNGLNTRREIENAEIQNQISETNLNEVKNAVQSTLQNAYSAYRSGLTLVELETENAAVAAENVDIAVERLRLGNITQLDFREAQINLLQAQSRLVNAQFQAKNAETELLRVSGELSRK